MTSGYPYFDKLLYGLLETGGYSQFTTLELRDAYAKQLSEAQISAVDIRKHIERHVNRMMNAKWVVRDTIHRKRGQVYHLKTLPDRTELKLVESRFMKQLSNKRPIESKMSAPQDIDKVEICSDKSSMLNKLEKLLKEIQSEFFSSLGKIKRFKMLIEEMPQLKSKIEHDLLETLNRSSELVGHLHAVERTISIVKSPQ